MKILLGVMAVLVLTAAVTPQEAADVAADSGYFIEVGADATPAVIGGAVAEMRDVGSLFYVIILAEDPPAGTSTYAESVLTHLPNGEGTVLAESPGTVGWAKHNSIWTTPELNQALDVSLDGKNSDEVVTLFVGSLLGDDASSGFPWFLTIVAIAIVVVGFLIWRSSRGRAKTQARAIEDLKADAQRQIDAIANDILDDVDEVAEANNAEAAQHFDEATTIYSDAAERLAAARTGHEVIGISTDLDTATWHLDCAEAILDGEPLPEKPQPPSLSEPEQETGIEMDSQSSAASRRSTSSLQYERRKARRSDYGAEDMMRTVVAMQAMRSIRRPSRGGGRSSSSARRSKRSGRARGGGKKRG